jgi:molecular chaperone GrpE
MSKTQDTPGNGAGQSNGQDDDVDLEATTVMSEDMAAEAVAEGQEISDELEALHVALENARAAAEENRDKYLRTAAELDNVRKRANRDLEKARRFGLEKFAAEILTVRDSLELGLQAAESADSGALREGLEATLKLLDTALKRFDVVEIESDEGTPFDPEVHEAMAAQDSTEVEPNTVLEVVQKGYQISGRLLRPARVMVSKEPDA